MASGGRGALSVGRGPPARNDGSDDPLRWFGENASPSVTKGRAAFADVLRLAVAAANARAGLLDLLSRRNGARIGVGENEGEGES